MTMIFRSKRSGLARFVACFAAASTVALSVHGCSNDASLADLAQGCNINSDCSSPLVCAFQSCHLQCATARDCPAGDLCVQSDRPFLVCEAPVPCKLNSQCPANQVCATDGVCRNSCQTARDCISGQKCVDHTCADPTSLTDGGFKGVDSGVDSSTNSGIQCVHNSDCPGSLVCLDLGVCGLECITTKDCSYGSTCINSRCVVPIPDGSTKDATLHDAMPDTGVDSGHDASMDSSHDSGMDSSHDSGMDSGHDAGHDSGHDAGIDAPILDAGTLTNYPTSGLNFTSGVFYAGKLYIGAGAFENSTIDPLYAFNTATGTWVAVSETTTDLDPQLGSSFVVVNGNLYAFAGAWSPSCGSYNAQLRELNLTTNTWSLVSDATTAMPTAFVGRTGTALSYYNGVFYSFGGLTCSGPGSEANSAASLGVNYYSLASMLTYTTATSTWAYTNPAGPTYQESAAGVTIGGNYYMMGGHTYQNGAAINSFYKYNYAAGTFTDLADNVFTTYTDTSNVQSGVATDGTNIFIVGQGQIRVYDTATSTMSTPATPLPAAANFNGTVLAYDQGSLYIKDSNSQALIRVNAPQ